MLRLIVYLWFLKYLRYKIRLKKRVSSDSTLSVMKARQRERFRTSYFSRTTMSATPCTCVSCLQSRDATSFLGPGWVGMKCSVSVTVEWAPTSLGGERGLKVVKERLAECWGTHPTTTSWPFCSPRPSTLNTTPTSIRGSGFVKVILAAISLPTTASPRGWWEEPQ